MIMSNFVPLEHSRTIQVHGCRSTHCINFEQSLGHGIIDDSNAVEHGGALQGLTGSGGFSDVSIESVKREELSTSVTADKQNRA